MASSPQPSSTRRRTYDYSHPPEQGLQEWASRIKSIQAEVDKDEEAEQKRLEEEIAASRLARAQRRAKQGSRRLSDIATGVPTPEPDQVKTPDSPRRNSNFGSARTLMSPKADPSSEPSPESPTKPSFGSARTNVVNPSPGAPVSLAAFIGGRATGPRLTKPAPQADTHDPNQFDQTQRWGGGPSASANAVQAAGRATKFGGSIALPGLGAIGKVSAPSSPATESPSRGPRALIPPQQPGATAHTRQRTSSSPTKPSSPTPSSPPKAQAGLTRSNTVARARAKSNANSNPNSPPKGPQSSLSSSFSTPPRVPAKSHTTPTQGSSPTYGLARPIQPTPPPQDPNKLPLAQNASPAFRATIHSSAKELSPSLTRLKGRGFVGSRVRQADGELSSPSSLGISSSPFGEREKPKRGNVQERWQAAIQGQGSSPSPASSGDGPPWKRRSLKEPIPFQTTSDSNTPGKAKGIVGSVTSHRSASPERMRDSMDEFGRRGSPVLSGASPVLSKASPVLSKASPVLTQASAVGTPGAGFDSAKSSIQPKPLNHLTRDRARKPKKGVQAKDIWKAPELPTTTPVGTPPQDHRPPSPFKRLRPVASQPSMRPPSPTKSPQIRDAPLPRPPPSPRTAANPLPPSPVRKAAQVFSNGPRPESPTKDNNVSRVKDMWAERAPIGVKPQRGHLTGPLFPSHTGPNLVGKRALPGMVTQSQQARPESPTRPSQVRPESPTKTSTPKPSTPKPSTPKPVSPVSPPRPVVPPASPGRHIRTPSTGNRATVMELAQTMLQKQDDFPPVFTDEQAASKARLSPGPPSPRPPSERRRSSYDRYSSIVMPPLKEEKTPAPTPAGTLSRSQELNVPPVETMPALPLPKSSPRMSPRPSPKMSPQALPRTSPRPSPKVQPAALPAEPKPKPADEIFHVDQTMAPIPPFNLQQVINSNPYNFVFPQNLKRISTDVFTVSGGQAMVVSTMPCVVYECELIAVVQRVRNESSGLIANKVWGWYGRKAQLGAKDEAKLAELAKQYGTTVIPSVQGEESQELVDAIGGHWITRQGSRAHWTPENTTMQCTRRLGDVCFTDEVDFHVSNLCSAYSYTITALDAVYVWHGRGATQGEREVAAAYGKSIVGPEKEISQFDEGKEDPMFFMLLGEDPWANADYWKCRAPLNKLASRPRMFSIDARDKKQPVSSHIPSENKLTPATVSVLDNILELFVIVGSEARARRTDILLGVHVAISIAAAVDPQRAFAPPVHLIVLPSQLPLDVRSGFFRFASDERVNPAGVPSHMNLLTLSEASEQLSASSWPRSKLQSLDYLPLGIHPSQLK